MAKTAPAAGATKPLQAYRLAKLMTDPAALAPIPVGLSTTNGQLLNDAKNAAYIGDGVYELLVRQWVAAHWPNNPDTIHTETTQRVCAEAQAIMLTRLQNIPNLFTEDDTAFIKRARNLPIPKQRRSQHQQYRAATALEALMGRWFALSPQKLRWIPHLLSETMNTTDS